MAAIWPGSRVPNFGIGDQLYFYNAGTSTPQPVYADGALSVARDQPILADARGMFPVIYLSPTPGVYRQKLTDANGVLIFDDDDIDVAQAASYVPPDPGTTDPTLLVTTGMRIGFYGTTAPAGWVRAAGRTIGSATSGATERANADCQALFLHLWTADSSLTVSGGRGASAAGDWAANKNIALPDYRERSPVGLATMGNSAAGRIADALVDASKNSSTLGATAGASSVTLTTAQIPVHTHGNGTLKMPNHGHPYRVSRTDGNTSQTDGQIMLRSGTNTAVPADTSTPPTGGYQSLIGGSGEMDLTGAIANAGSGNPHTNMQPTVFELVLIKL
jgi:microcystin-dependent protein